MISPVLTSVAELGALAIPTSKFVHNVSSSDVTGLAVCWAMTVVRATVLLSLCWLLMQTMSDSPCGVWTEACVHVVLGPSTEELLFLDILLLGSP